MAAEWKVVAEKDSAKANANLAIATKEQGGAPAAKAYAAERRRSGAFPPPPAGGLGRPPPPGPPSIRPAAPANPSLPEGWREVRHLVRLRVSVRARVPEGWREVRGTLTLPLTLDYKPDLRLTAPSPSHSSYKTVPNPHPCPHATPNPKMPARPIAVASTPTRFLTAPARCTTTTAPRARSPSRNPREARQRYPPHAEVRHRRRRRHLRAACC